MSDPNLCTLSFDEKEEPCIPVNEEIELFEPVPYTFTLKDALGNKVLYASEEINNVQVSCPAFHLLLDHVLAVLWILYSEERINILQTSHLYWVLKFLEGLKNEENEYTPDIQIVIEHLKIILVNVYSQVDVDVLEKQNNDQQKEYSKYFNSSIGKSNRTYVDFKDNLEVLQENNMMNPTPLKPSQECPASSSDTYKSENTDSASQIIECPSYIIQNLLEEDQRTMCKILEASFAKEKCPSSKEDENSEELSEQIDDCQMVPYDSPAISNPTSQVVMNLTWREDVYQEMREQLKCMDEKLKTLSCGPAVDNPGNLLCQQNKKE